MKQYGFIEPKIEKEHYILGASVVPNVILQEDGDWSDSLPTEEKQSPTFETYNCTSFNTLNQIEQYIKKAFGLSENYSDRWVGIIAGTKAPGNDPHLIYENIRKYGLIPESMLPFSSDLQNIDEYYSFKGADKEACYAEGKKWLERFDLKHEWVFSPDQPLDEKINNMKVALKYSPLAISVYAWATDNNGVYISLGQPNHWTSEYAYDEVQHIFDSYDPFKKLVEQEILYCKRIHISLKKKDKTGLLDIIINFLKWFFKEKLVYREFKKFWIYGK